MTKPIYVLFMGKSTEAWYQLTAEEQDSIMAQVGPEAAGGKSMLVCDSSWANEQYLFFGVHEFPNIEAVQKHSARLNELNWFRYVDSTILLGTEWAAG